MCGAASAAAGGASQVHVRDYWMPALSFPQIININCGRHFLSFL